MASGLVNNKYRITRRIGGGSFGEIYMGIGPNNEKVRFCEAFRDKNDGVVRCGR